MSAVSSPSAAFHWPIRVYYEDTDAGGVVYHATYLKFMERARTEWLRHLGFEQDALREEQGVVMAVRRMDLRFVSPARFNERLRVETAIIKQGRASLDFQQRVMPTGDTKASSGQEIPHCTATVNIACVAWPEMRPAPIPPSVVAAIAQLQAHPGEHA